MKHDVNINLPTQELEALIDKATEAAVTIIVTLTVAHIFKSLFGPASSRGKHAL